MQSKKSNELEIMEDEDFFEEFDTDGIDFIHHKCY